MDPQVILLLLAGCYVGWNIGANDAANCIGTSVGSGLLSYKTAILLVAGFAILGALLQGHHVMNTIGEGIVPAGSLSMHGVLAALLISGFFVTIATFFSIPVSTSQAIVGGVIGVGCASQGVHGVKFDKVLKIVECWILCPIMTMILSAGFLVVVLWFFRKMKRVQLARRILAVMVFISACYVSFSLGANNVGNAMGPITNIKAISLPSFIIILLGGLAMGIGAMTFGKRVTRTVGSGITPLDLPGAFSAQMAAGFGLHFFSLIGIPVSTSQAIVGGVIGAGLIRGAKTVSVKQITQIAVGWIVTPTLAAFAAFIIFILFVGA